MESTEAPLAWYFEYDDGTTAKHSLCLSFSKPESQFAFNIKPLYPKDTAECPPSPSTNPTKQGTEQ